MPVTRQASREDVLDIAARVFAERGFGETSLRQLIAETGMSPTAFYARYPSKQAVLEALVQRVLSQIFLSSSTALAKAKSVDAAVAGIADVLHAALSGHKAVIRLIMTEAPVLPGVRDALLGAYGGFARLVASYLTRHRVPNPEAGGWAMLGAIYLQIMRWAVFDDIDDAGLVAELRTTAGLLRTIVR
jgi:AcrR family transcriptional regulator